MPHGVLAFHVSNRYFDLRPVVARLALDAHMTAYLGQVTRLTPAESREGKEESVWVVMARQPSDIVALGKDPRWIPASPNLTGAAWTDDYANVLETLKAVHDITF
jgi:hypothetical protein